MERVHATIIMNQEETNLSLHIKTSNYSLILVEKKKEQGRLDHITIVLFDLKSTKC